MQSDGEFIYHSVFASNVPSPIQIWASKRGFVSSLILSIFDSGDSSDEVEYRPLGSGPNNVILLGTKESKRTEV